LFWTLIIAPYIVNAQLNVVNHELEWMFDNELSKGDTVWNSNSTSLEAYFIFDELITDTFNFPSKNKFLNWMFNENIYGVDNQEYSFRLNPIFDIKTGGGNYISTRRGGYVTGTIGSKFQWSSSFYENYQRFDSRITKKVEFTTVAPGEAEVKNPIGPSDYSVSTGGLSYTFSKYYKFTAGHGKNFIGNGYRSLLLSDAAGNYPFLRNDITIGRVKYTSVLGEFLDYTNDLVGDNLKRKKYGSFHYLDVLASKKLKIAFFEAVIWEADSSSRTELELNYLNPFVLIRPLEYNIGSPDNMLLGLNLSWNIYPCVSVYGQLVMDELHSDNLLNNPTWWANKYGFQSGIKLHQLPIKNLVILGEHNSVRPFTYSHKTSGKNYGHNYNSLAHPYGANFREFIGVVNDRLNRFNVNARIAYIKGGEESSEGISNGTDIFKSYLDREFESGYVIGYGENYKQLYIDAKLSYILNPKYLLMFETGYQNRTEWLNQKKENHHYLYFGLKTSLFNLYYDY
jgi:hypothetical protein